MKKILLISAILIFSGTGFFAQLKFGSDIYSRYIWRGINLGGDSPSLQPGLSYTIHNFTIGFWGAYSYPSAQVVYSENDLYASYSITADAAGSFALIATDYYIPSIGIPLGHYEKDGGAHVIEGGLSYSGPETFPISISGYLNLYNDTDNSAYIQVGYPFTIEDATLSLAAGFVPAKSVYYLTEKGALINFSLTAAKSVAITDKFSVPINVSYIVNPDQDISYLVFGASFTF